MTEENGAVKVVYVVQVREWVPDPGDPSSDGIPVWRDAATVEVSPRTKRKTVVERALAQAGDDVRSIDMPLLVRVLSPEDARPFSVSSVQRDPELRIDRSS